MYDIIRDSPFGETVRFLSHRRLMYFSDEVDDTVLEKEFALHTDEVTGEIVRLVGWYGPDDPDNPQNWKKAKRIWITVLIGFITSSIYLGAAIFTPGIQEIRDKFDVGVTVSELPLALYAYGYSVGPMFLSPLSENEKIGRNNIYIWTLLIFVILQIPTALTNSFAALCILRFICGIFASPALANGGASMGDIYQPLDMPYVLPAWSTSTVLGPTLGPLLGGAMVIAKNYRWTFWLLMWINSIGLVAAFFFLPETLASNILYKRALRLKSAEKKIRNSTLKSPPKDKPADQENAKSKLEQPSETESDALTEFVVVNVTRSNSVNRGVLDDTHVHIGRDKDLDPQTDETEYNKPENGANNSADFVDSSQYRLVTMEDLQSEKLTRKAIVYEILVRPLIIIILEPGVLALNIYIGLLYSIMYSWFEGFPIVFQSVYGFGTITTGATFMALAVACSIGVVIYIYFVVDKYIIVHFNAVAEGKEEFSPEKFIYVAIYYSIVIPFGLLFFGWSATAKVHWIVPMIASGIVFIPIHAQFQLIFIYLGASYPRYIASVFAGNGLIRGFMAGSFPLFSYQMFQNLGPQKFPVAWGSTILAGISAVMCLIPLVLFVKGKQLRGRSKYAN